jgi:hypothetical protein
VFDLRGVYSHFQTFDFERRHFFERPVGARHYFELDDLPDFLDAIDRQLPNEAPVGFFSGMSHEYHARYRLYPRQVLVRNPGAPYIIAFQDPAITFQNEHLVESGIPLQGRFEQVFRFGPSAAVFRRLHD